MLPNSSSSSVDGGGIAHICTSLPMINDGRVTAFGKKRKMRGHGFRCALLPVLFLLLLSSMLVMMHYRISGSYATERSNDEADRAASPTSTTPPSSHGGTTTTTTTTPPHDDNDDKQLNVVMLAALVFYSVSGGPFGVEATVRAAGNFYCLAGFLVFPLVWSIPEAAVTAELGSSMPEAAGGVAWVERAFGARAGWMAGYLGWLAGATDNAIYPVLFLEYLLQMVHAGDDDDENANNVVHPVARFLFLSTTSIALSYINWLGLDVVGKVLVAICAIAMSPFLLLTLVGAFQVEPSRWFQMPQAVEQLNEDTTDEDISGGFFPNAAAGGVLWRPFLNGLFWNLNSFDAAACFSADVRDPGVTFPRGMFWSVIMVVAGYFVPLLIALGASDATQGEWKDGYFATVATNIAGPWLGAWLVFAAGISNIALFQAELSADAFQLMGMADRGHLPKIFTERSQHGTPTYGILLGAAVIVVLGASNLENLIEMLNFNYALSLLLEYSAFIKLRVSRPDMHRPWRLPLNTFGCIILLIPTFACTLAIIALATYTTFVFSIGANVVGLLLFLARKRSVSAANTPQYAVIQQ